MRMALCWPSLILLIFGFSIHANAAASKSNYILTPELTNFIPTCAQECFLSFLDGNFPPGTCSTKPTLDCLCSTNSTSGYTIGEGAVQCIISEINIGFCQGSSAKDSVVNGAYGMCTGQKSALPNTHATITATLILQTSMPSIVLVAPAPSISSVSGQSSSVIASTTTNASSSPLATATSRPSPSSSASSTVSSVPAASETVSPEPILTKNQIVGITVASIGGGVVAVGLLILFICCRRRKKRARESDLIPFQLEPNHVMNQKKYKYKSFKGPTERKPGGTKNGVAAKVPPRVPPRLDTSSPNMFSRRSIRPDTIGLAISPEQAISTEKQQRRSSKLLPEKPILTLKVPKQAEKPINGLSFNQPTVQPSAISRQSTATQFEEDYDESADTAVAADDSWTAKSTDQILDAGTGTWQTIRQVDPEGTCSEAYHWRPMNNFASQSIKNGMSNPDYYVRPLSVTGRKIGSFSQPRVPNAYPRQQDQQLSVPQQSRPITTSSSVYSARGSVSSNDQGRNSNSRPHRFSYQKTGPYDNQDSAVSSQDRDQDPKTAGTDYPLSPVVESPASGRSPVSYPKIPPPGAGGMRRLSQSTIRMVPPPPQPDFTKALGAGKPWRQAEIAAQIERERAARAQAQENAQKREQGQMGMHSLHRQESQRPREARENNQTTTSPISFAFPAPPPQALIPGRSQTTSPPAIPSPYLFRSPSQSKLVPPPLLRSRSQLQREARTPPPSQNQGGFVSQQGQLQTVTESPPTTRMAPTPPPGLLSTRSPLTRVGRTPSPNLNQGQLQNQSHTRPQQQTQTLQSVTDSPTQHSRTKLSPPPLLRSRSQLQREARTLPPLQTQLSQPAHSQPQSAHPQSATTTSYRPFPGNPNPLSSHPSITFTRSSSLVSQNSLQTTLSTSTSSSLLAKRRGTEKASTLTLKNEEDRKKQIAKWRVLKREEIELAKKEGWRPMLGREGGEPGNGGTGNGGWLGPREYEFERTELPTTPGWVPKLTPTRRGDELFLSVQ
ncbi:hypothetical protein ONS95_005959 [Cadophora gregata]|uniref:uncharacterized protein n=1 Tax=Cadophora gregata TaxID=51156 RepID=UPI0026DD22A8|nr:uncharacterized protein ONS95_005959 [Cadophora gregata]KAK0102336.1 hypothetical protein ONS95_005959 [Cadophora gregata]